VPIGTVIEGANRHDMKLVRLTIESIVVKRPELKARSSRRECV